MLLRPFLAQLRQSTRTQLTNPDRFPALAHPITPNLYLASTRLFTMSAPEAAPAAAAPAGDGPNLQKDEVTGEMISKR